MTIEASIIVPAFNMEKFVGETVLSVRNQRGIRLEHIELIAINDGSSDKTENIIEELAKNYAGFIKFINLKDNSGVLTATVEGLKAARGKYICLLDADDVWHSSKLSEVITCFNDGYDLVFHEGEFIDIKSVSVNRPVRCLIADDKIADSIMTFEGGLPLGSSISFRRSMLDMNLLESLYESFKSKNADRFVYQDSAILHTLMSRKDLKIKCIKKNLYGYRLHEDNSSLNSDFDNDDKLMKVFNKGLYTTLFAVEIYKKCGLYYENKRIETGFNKFLYCKNFSLREKGLLKLYREYYYLLRNNAFKNRKEKFTKFIYPFFFRLPVKIRQIIRQYTPFK